MQYTRELNWPQKHINVDENRSVLFHSREIKFEKSSLAEKNKAKRRHTHTP